MKHILTAIIATFSVVSMAQSVATHIDNVVVYQNGATVTRTGTMNIQKGTHTYKFESLTQDMSPNSVRIVIKNDKPTVVSFNCKKDKVVSDDRSATIKKLREEKQEISKTLSELDVRKRILENERSIIFENDKVGTDKGVDVASLSQMAKYYKSQLSTINSQLVDNSKKRNKCIDRLNLINQSIVIEKNSLTSEYYTVNLTLESTVDISNVQVELSYLVDNASWKPAYDVRIKDITKPFSLDYIAHIKQNTSEEWKDVHLTLSTADPTVDNTKPKFSKITFPGNMKGNVTKVHGNIIGNIVRGNIVGSDDGTGLPGVIVREVGTQNQVISEIDGKFRIMMQNTSNKLEFSFIGYESQQLTPGGNMNVVMEPNAVLDEVVVVGYGVQPTSGSYERTQKVAKTLPISIEQTVVANQEYAIKLPYTIPSDDKDHSVNMFTYNVESDYKYSCMPRFSKDVYLVATVPSGSNYSLLPAEANLYIDNAYQGHTYVLPDNVTDTLSISAGCDKAIAVSREEVRTNTAKSFIGSTVRVSKCYEIVIKNNKTVAADVEIIDQYPISRTSDVKVTLTESADAVIDKEKGKLTWNVTLAPREQRKIRFSYDVVHPKYKKIVVD